MHSAGLTPEECAERLAARAAVLGFEGTRDAVRAALQGQLERTAAALHAALPDSAAAAALSSRDQAESRPSGLGYLGRAGATAAAASRAAPAPPEPPVQPTQPLGFRLEAGPSGIQHAAAGLGVWLRGRASLGQVVALYPGVVYRPLFHRSIPGYPMVATDNEFLLSRLDGAAVDGKPWGLGSLGAEPWPPFPPRNRAEELLSRLEPANFLALGHMINHPPAGRGPNVLVAAFDWQTPAGKAHLRAFIPNIEFTQEPALDSRHPVPGVALVAARDLHDEELFLNYRLNPNLPSLPDWYSPVDPEEDARRWG